ncbi:hypothetical protein GCM10029992_16490 [Glycomyces albus]
MKGKRAGSRVGPPRFKRRSHRQAAWFTRNGFALRGNGRLYVAKVGDRRDDWLHKQVETIVAQNQGIYVEDLNVKGLARGRGAQSIHDAALGRFAALLESKAARTGRTFARVDRYFLLTTVLGVW